MPPENVCTGDVAALPQADHLEHLVHARRHERRLDAVELGVQAQVLLGAQVAVERLVLEHEADVAADVVALADRRRGRRRGALPPVGFASVQSMLMVVVLPAPFGPEEAEDLTGGDLEADAAHGLDLAEGLL